MNYLRRSTFLVAVLASTFGQSQTYVPQEISKTGFANAIAGRVAGGSLANHAVLWDLRSMIDVNPVGATFSAIYGRSGDISVGVAGTAPLAQDPVIWNGTTPSLLSVPFAYVAGRGIDTDGVQIVGYATEGNLERGAGAQHALLWNVSGGVVDLGKNMQINGVGGGQQAGGRIGSNGVTAGFWSGTANSFVSLHPRFADVSVATDADNGVQVGYYGVNVRVFSEGRPRDIRFYSAGFWTGTADSFTYLPSTYRHSFALGVNGDTIVGYGNTTDLIGFPQYSHAVAWVGPNHSMVDLHALLDREMVTSRATGVDERGNITGWGVSTSNVVKSFVWVRQ